MKKATHRIGGLLIASLVLAAWGGGTALAQEPTAGQGAGGQSSGDQGSGAPGTGGAPPAATGLDTQSEISENPPLSGLDQPSFEPGFGARSYLAPKVQVSEAVSSNPSASINNLSGVSDITRATGSLDLQKLWKIHPLDLAYVGGLAWFHGGSRQKGVYQVHSMNAVQRLLWRTGQLAIRDNFSYLPQGSFGFGSFGSGLGGLGGLGAGAPGGGSFGGGSFGTNGNTPRIDNVGMVDITQALSPRSSVVLAGGFGILHFLNSPPGFINSEQTTSQAGYNYLLTKKDQIAFSYSFQEFHFPRANAGDVNVNLWQVYYAHRVSGKLDFNVGGGPQWIHANGYAPVTLLGQVFLIPLHTSRISGAGRVGVIYRWSSRTNIALNYSHYTTPGSGFFPGANTDSLRFVANHQLTRRWGMDLDTGYSRNTRILNTTSSNSPAGNSHTYNYWYGGGGMRRQLSRQFEAFANYQYDRLLFGSGFCGKGGACRSGYGRHTGMIGLDWTPRPIRLD